MSLFEDVHIQTTSMRDVIYELLREKIINGQLKPGEKITESKLSEQLEVSRTPLREALLRLETQGLVERLPNGRLQVADIHTNDLEDYYAVREVIEGLVAREAAKKANELQIEKLHEILKNLEDAVNRAKGALIVEYSQLFHHKITEIAANKKCVQILKEIEVIVKRQGHYSLNLEGRAPVSLEEHKEIFHWISRRNPEKAEEAMRRHIVNVCAALLEKIKHLSNLNTSVQKK